jgi:hypothetical protein
MELHHLIFTHLSIVSDDCATAIETNDVEPVLTDINADYGNRTLCCRSHGVLLVLAPRPAYRWRGRSTPDHPITGHTYSITSSARPSSVTGMVRPSNFAVLRLMTSVTLVICWTGRSAAFSPLRNPETSESGPHEC